MLAGLDHTVDQYVWGEEPAWLDNGTRAVKRLRELMAKATEGR